MPLVNNTGMNEVGRLTHLGSVWEEVLITVDREGCMWRFNGFGVESTEITVSADEMAPVSVDGDFLDNDTFAVLERHGATWSVVNERVLVVNGESITIPGRAMVRAEDEDWMTDEKVGLMQSMLHLSELPDTMRHAALSNEFLEDIESFLN